MPSAAVRQFHREAPSMRVLRWIILPFVVAHVVLATFSGYRAIWQIRGLDIRTQSAALRPGSIVGFELVSWGRTEADGQLELIQGAVAETLATTFLPRNRLAVYDSRTQRGAASVMLTPARLARFTSGPAILRATGYGSMQWLRTPPPTIREQRVDLFVRNERSGFPRYRHSPPGATAFQPFPATTRYFGPETQQWMINFRVANLDAGTPHFLYFYRDSLKQGVDSAYRVIENDAARICADRHCPNPYVGLETLTAPHEVWWLNTFATPADTARVAKTYVTDRGLATALSHIAQRKAALIGTPVQGFAIYRPDLSRGPSWSVAGARFIVATITRDRQATGGSVWMTSDSTLYILRAVRTDREAEALRRETGGRVLAIRPNWSMPAPAWVKADPAFWHTAPVATSPR